MQKFRSEILVGALVLSILVGFGFFSYRYIQLENKFIALQEKQADMDKILLPLNTLGHQIMNTANGGKMEDSEDFISALYAGYTQISNKIQENQQNNNQATIKP